MQSEPYLSQKIPDAFSMLLSVSVYAYHKVGQPPDRSVQTNFHNLYPPPLTNFPHHTLTHIVCHLARLFLFGQHCDPCLAQLILQTDHTRTTQFMVLLPMSTLQISQLVCPKIISWYMYLLSKKSYLFANLWPMTLWYLYFIFCATLWPVSCPNLAPWDHDPNLVPWDHDPNLAPWDHDDPWISIQTLPWRPASPSPKRLLMGRGDSDVYMAVGDGSRFLIILITAHEPDRTHTDMHAPETLQDN
jgi:hypothetical protein